MYCVLSILSTLFIAFVTKNVFLLFPIKLIKLQIRKYRERRGSQQVANILSQSFRHLSA